jgi:hypothetical protein
VARTSETPQGLDAPLAAGHDAPYHDATGVQPQFAAQAEADRPGRDAGRAMRLVALVAVVIGLLALTAAACVLSYSSMHYLAVQADVSARLASIYPLIFDALLVLAGCSVLALRGAGLVSRIYGWLCMLVLLGCLAAGGALRAATTKIPHRTAGVVAAIVPWVLVLIGFGLLLALLRYARIRRLGQQHAKAAAGQEERALPDPATSAGLTPPPGVRPTDLQLRARIPRQPTDDQTEANPVPGPVGWPTPFMPRVEHESPGERDIAEQAVAADEPVAPDEPVARDQPAAGQLGGELCPAPIQESTGEEASGPPAFNRTRSSPTPPQE